MLGFHILLAAMLLAWPATFVFAQDAGAPITFQRPVAGEEILWDAQLNRFALPVQSQVVTHASGAVEEVAFQLLSLDDRKLSPPLSLGTLPAATATRVSLRLTSTDLFTELARAHRKVRMVATFLGGRVDETVELGDRRGALLRLCEGYVIADWRSRKFGDDVEVWQTVIVPVELAGHRLSVSWEGAQGALLPEIEVNGRILAATSAVRLAPYRAGDRLALRFRLRPGSSGASGLRVRLMADIPGLAEVARLHLAAAYLLGREAESSARLGALCEALARAEAASFKQALAAAQRDLADARSIAKDFTVHLVGNAHIDVAWRWTWAEAIEFCRRTFSQALGFMDEYPDFTFSQNQAQTYEWMEERYPEVFDAIKKRAAEGRWEVVGGTWVENDLVLPAGESTVRQFLYGKRYFKEKLGVDVKVGWMVDVFGYPGFLPQVLRKCGIQYFVGMKCNATNDTTPLPHMLFEWQGLDGSRVTYFTSRWGWYDREILPETLCQDARGMRERAHPLTRPAGDLSPGERLKTSPAGDLSPGERLKTFPAGDRSPGERLKTDVMVLYGVGDSGGGPTREQIEAAHEIDRMATAPNVRLVTSEVFFHAQKGRALPVIAGDLYQQAHQGTFTSQARTKDNNRRAEMLLLSAEKWSWLARHCAEKYPVEDLAAAWKLLLFNQGHDILPGSSFPRVYADSYRQFEEIFARGARGGGAGRAARQADTGRRLAHRGLQRPALAAHRPARAAAVRVAPAAARRLLGDRPGRRARPRATHTRRDRPHSLPRPALDGFRRLSSRACRVGGGSCERERPAFPIGGGREDGPHRAAP
ncbi:hypothetical protein HS125_17400 [bacterium]|nr:hypothetical protein [bacterium]